MFPVGDDSGASLECHLTKEIHQVSGAKPTTT
jgi:hypothetical protein